MGIGEALLWGLVVLAYGVVLYGAGFKHGMSALSRDPKARFERDARG